MKKPISFGSIGVELVSSLDGTKASPERETPFTVCIMGDFSGRSSRGIREPLKNRSPLAIDRDTIDEVLKRLRVGIRLDSAGAPLDIAFECLDDFHPDHLAARIDILRVLLGIRRRLGDSRTCNAALKDLHELTGIATTKPEPSKRGDEKVQQEGSILDRMLGEAAGSRGVSEPGASLPDLNAFVESVVRPHLVAGKDPERDRIITALDRAISGLVAEVMHHETFQSLEASWRGIQFLVSRVETDEYLKLHLLDISKDELAADLMAAENLALTGTYRLLSRGDVGSEEPWSLIVGDYSFDYSDAGTLGRLAKIAAAAGAPFISQADSCLVGCSSLDGSPDPATWRDLPGRDTLDVWNDLRHLPEAAYVGLVMPRFLLRLPFGRDTDAAETFDFEEMGDAPVHTHYLWGNPAFACACLLAQAFSLAGWEMEPGDVSGVDRLPLHVYEEQGASGLKPCAEVLLSEKAIDAILDAGIMPLATLKDTDTARLVRFQSIREPLTGLAGRWDA